jgi:hypothetical protein
LEHFARNLPEWGVVGCSRRHPTFGPRSEYICADLLDADATRNAFASSNDITHVLYAANLDLPNFAAAWTEKDHIEFNLRMLRNTLDGLEAAGAPLRSFAFLQGTKAYGVHLGPLKAPARESDPMHMPPSFYHAQQDYVFNRQRNSPWTWTIYRPQIVTGICPGAPINIISSVAVYCVISRELGLPLRFPGHLYAGLVEMVDARLMARAAAWGALNPQASANQIFNVANGDVVDWNVLFEQLARHFNMELGRPQRMSMAAMMADKEPVWDAIVKKYELAPLSYRDVQGTWAAMDFLFVMGNSEPPPIVSTVKIRKAGFTDCVDTEQMFIDYIREMQELRHIPK